MPEINNYLDQLVIVLRGFAFVSMVLALLHAVHDFRSGQNVPWRTEHTPVEIVGDDLWIGEKFQPNHDIAGSPRNSFRASRG